MKLRSASIVASVFGIGYFSFAQGTIMSALALPLAFLIMLKFGWLALFCAALIVFCLGIFACAEHMRETGREDPPECVIDELAGQWFACVLAPLTLPAFALAFVLFRLFDIWKPWPVSWGESLSGGVGVMADDLIAGAMAGAIVFAIHVSHVSNVL
jgi:phosphatidylglycerophosphatase A